MIEPKNSSFSQKGQEIICSLDANGNLVSCLDVQTYGWIAHGIQAL